MLNQLLAPLPRKTTQTIAWFILFAAALKWLPNPFHPPAAPVAKTAITPALPPKPTQIEPTPNHTVPPGSPHN